MINRVGGMTYAALGQAALNYFPCRYGTSKLLFRGPRRRLQDDYVAYLGGIETYGKFIETPFPTLVEHETGIKSVNLGCVNAGIDAYLNDRSLMSICTRAKVTVIEAMGAQNMSNRFYAVHPRRNDRFLHASSLLRMIYADVDFTEFNFTRHMLNALKAASPENFGVVRQELKDAWAARMKTMIAQIDGPVVVLWLTGAAESGGDVRRRDALFVDKAMVDALAKAGPQVRIVRVEGAADEVAAGLDEMIFDDMERPAAEEMLGPVVHRRVSQALGAVLPGLM